MKKGKQYLWYNDDCKNHPLVSALHASGIKQVDLVYATHWSTDAGWNLLNSSIGAVWLGYTKKDALIRIHKLSIDPIIIEKIIRYNFNNNMQKLKRESE